MNAPSHAPRALLIRVPASTSNIGPGFDCLGMALTLPFDFEIRPAAGASVLTIDGEEAPRDAAASPFFRALRAVYARAEAGPAPELKVRVGWKAPLGRGFGASGAACAAGALAANAFLGNPFASDELFGICLEIEGHPDNAAAALFGGLALVARGKKRSMIHVYEPAPLWKLAFLVPDYEVATPEARKALPKRVSRAAAVYNLARLPLLLDALAAGDAVGLRRAMGDKLHQAVRAKSIRRYKRIVEAAREAGAAGVFISGSGPSIGAFCKSGRQARDAAKAMQAACEGASFGAKTLLAEPTMTAAQLAELGQ